MPPTGQRHPIEELEDLTVDAARRLLRTRLRQSLVEKAAAVDQNAGLDNRAAMRWIVADLERSIEADAEAVWVTVCGLWRKAPCDDQTGLLRACLRRAVAEAVEQSARFLQDKRDEYSNEAVDTWVQGLVSSVDEDDLVKKI